MGGHEVRLTGALPGDAPPNRAVADLRALQGAVRSGAEYLVTDQGVEIVRPGRHPLDPAPGYMQCRSGGTTGAPKSIRRRHASWIASFEINRDRFGLTAGSSSAVLGRIVHSLALYGILEAAHLGANIHLLADLRPARQREMLAHHAVRLLYATPTQLRLLCTAPEGPAALPDLRQILCGGGALTGDIRARVQTVCPNATLTEFYGASETSFIAITDDATPPGSVGKPYPGVEIRIEAGGYGAGVGEVWVRSPYLFDGYASGSSPDTRWQDGFLTVGELGYLDDQGYLYLSGRKTRMVTIADQNVFPEEVEALIQRNPRVAHCAVLAVPDTRRGHVLMAVLSGPECPEVADEVQRVCRAVLGPLKAPRQVYFLKDFPLLPSGKPDLRSLAAWVEAMT